MEQDDSDSSVVDETDLDLWDGDVAAESPNPHKDESDSTSFDEENDGRVKLVFDDSVIKQNANVSWQPSWYCLRHPKPLEHNSTLSIHDGVAEVSKNNEEKDVGVVSRNDGSSSWVDCVAVYDKRRKQFVLHPLDHTISDIKPKRKLGLGKQKRPARRNIRRPVKAAPTPGNRKENKKHSTIA